MAVHPADDRKLVIDRSPRGAASTFTILTVVLAVVIVACLGVLGYGLVSDSDSSPDGSPDDQATREAVMSQADQFVLRVNTYGPGDLDDNNALSSYAEGVREVITAKFAVSFDENLTLAEQSVAQAGYARNVDLYATGVESSDADQATVLVAGVINGSYPDSGADAEDGDRVEFEPQPFRFKVTLVKAEGEWLVDDFAPLTGEITDPAGEPVPTEDPTVSTPSTTPTQTPKNTPTKKPSSKPTQKPTKKQGSGS